MNTNNDQPDLKTIEKMVLQWHEGSLSVADAQRLNQMLLQSAEGRRLFLQHAQLDAGLHWNFVSKQQVSSLINSNQQQGAQPVAGIAQQHLRLSDDQHFNQMMNVFGRDEDHQQAWLQIYPRMRALAILHAPSAKVVEQILDQTIDRLLSAYGTSLSVEELWQVCESSFRSSIDSVRSRHPAQQSWLAPELAEPLYSVLQLKNSIDVLEFFEILDERIPHMLAPSTLRMLCLRYLHGFPPNQVAVHFECTEDYVHSELADVRVSLTNNFLNEANADDSRASEELLRRWSRRLDHRDFSASEVSNLATNLVDNPANCTAVLLLAMTHDFLERQLSAVRLLGELAVQGNRSFQIAIERSIKDIENFAVTQQRVKQNSHVTASKNNLSVQVAAVIGLAAGFLIAVSLLFWSGEPPQVAKQEPQQPPAEAASTTPPNPDAPQPVPPKPLPPVVAVISELVDFPTDDESPLSVGMPLRKAQELQFDEGLLQLTTTAGSTLVFEGPSHAVIVDKNHVLLNHGKLVGLNDTPGQSLVVESNRHRVVDLGTEFGVAVNQEQEASVAVYQGEVAIAARHEETNLADAPTLHVEAGRETRIDKSGVVPSQTQPLTHEREFIRVDELELHKQAAAGSAAAATRVKFYGLLRIEGLLAFQAFDSASSANDFVTGYAEPRLRQVGKVGFGANLDSSYPLGESGTIIVPAGTSCYLDLDTSENSLVAKAGLVDGNGLIGRKAGELWLAWRTQAVGFPGLEFSWAGLSLMFGDERAESERLFIGNPSSMSEFGVHANIRAGAPQEQKITLDTDQQLAGTQSLPVDFKPHQWILRLKIDDRQAVASVWCDVAISEVEATAPHARYTFDDCGFDRFRLEARTEDNSGAWKFDDLTLALSSDALAKLDTYLTAPGQPAQNQ